ncbi:MAG: flavin reductase [bacterium]|nr:flavin reductase [bacterium]
MISTVLHKADFDSMETRYRTRFFNSLTGMKSANLIGTRDESGHTNLAIFSSAVHVGANPPLIGLIVRPQTVPRHTFQNILETGWFTVNHVTRTFYREAHRTSARYAEGESEFARCGLTEQYGELHPAPYVKESVVKLGLRHLEDHYIKTNGTILVIGQVLEIMVPEALIGPDGYVDIEAAGSLAVSGLDSYHLTERLERLPYAKADEEDPGA